MAKSFTALYSSQNVRLFDLLFRHQVYLEGVKGGLANDYKRMLTLLYAQFAKYLFEVRYSNMNAFTKLELAAFIYKFQRAQIQFYSQFTQQLIDLLKQFAYDDVTVSTAIFTNITGLTPDEADAKRDHPATLGPAAVDGSDAGNALLWAKIANAPVPANGQTIGNMLAYMTQAHSNDIDALLWLAWSNRWTVDQTRIALFGNGDLGRVVAPNAGLIANTAVRTAITDSLNDQSPDKQTDSGEAVTTRRSNELWNTARGLGGKWLSQGTAVLNTSLQHTSNVTQSGVASLYFEQYQWVSILDSRTTAICWSRSGNIYVYGIGPLPPAHINCRSKAVALLGTLASTDLPDSFYAWIMTQPKQVQSDLLGGAVTAKLRRGVLTEKNLQLNSTIPPMSITDFLGKVDSIIQ